MNTIKAEDIESGDWYASQYMGKYAWPPGAEIQIVVPLTPAMQHADELLQVAKTVIAHCLPGPAMNAARVVLEKIEPQPVTLDEALTELLKIVKSHDARGFPTAADICIRAKATGQIK